MRVPQPEGTKGSLKWVQRLVARRPDILEAQLREAGALGAGAAVEWRSPREADQWAEYRDGAFLDLLGRADLRASLRQFWPTGGPQWDALGCTAGGSIFLVEAKAHVGELASSCGAKAPVSLALIEQSIASTGAKLGISAAGDWKTSYYQYANRLAHLHFLRENGVDAYLVFVYFVGDTGMPGTPLTTTKWERAVAVVHGHLGIEECQPILGVVESYVDVGALV